MEKDPFKDALPALKNISLSAEEKSAIRLRLLQHMRANPVSPFLYSLKHFFTLRPVSVFALSALLIFSTGGLATFASGSSLPGDALYPLKTGVSEPVTGFFKSFSLQEQVRFEWDLMETRLIEAERLATEVFSERKEKIRQAVTAQRNKAESVSRKLLEREDGRGLAVSTQSRYVNAVSAPDSAASDRINGEETKIQKKEVPEMAPAATESSATIRAQAAQKENRAMDVPPAVSSEMSTQFTAAAKATTSAAQDSSVAPALETRTPKAASLSPEELRVPETEEAVGTGERIFEEMNRIYEKHRDIVNKLDLPLPYGEVKKRGERGRK